MRGIRIDNWPAPLSELDRYLDAPAESSNVDAKGCVAWDSGVESAALAKDIVAFANSRDGGVLVIGKTEPSPGQFVLEGLSDDQARTFDTTEVAKWVNNRFSPPVNVVCHQFDRDGAKFVIITVSEFDDIPILCTKSLQHPSDPKRHVLRAGTIYIRNTNAESAPLETVEDLRTLVGLATSKRGGEMLKMFESMLKGKPLFPAPTDYEQFDQELHQIEEGLGESYAKQLNKGAWRLIVRPVRYEPDRWRGKDRLEAIIRKHAVRIGRDFPGFRTGTHMREWGIANDTYLEIWTLATSGQFLCIRPFWENQRTYKSPWVGTDPDPDLQPGSWIDLESNLLEIVEMFMFAARLVEEYEPGEEVDFRLQATALRGRTLANTNLRISFRLDDGHPCQADAFKYPSAWTTMRVEKLRVAWKEHCATAMRQFIEYFAIEPVDLKLMKEWIDRFESRRA